MHAQTLFSFVILMGLLNVRRQGPGIGDWKANVRYCFSWVWDLLGYARTTEIHAKAARNHPDIQDPLGKRAQNQPEPRHISPGVASGGFHLKDP